MLIVADELHTSETHFYVWMNEKWGHALACKQMDKLLRVLQPQDLRQLIDQSVSWRRSSPCSCPPPALCQHTLCLLPEHHVTGHEWWDHSDHSRSVPCLKTLQISHCAGNCNLNCIFKTSLPEGSLCLQKTLFSSLPISCLPVGIRMGGTLLLILVLCPRLRISLSFKRKTRRKASANSRDCV